MTKKEVFFRPAPEVMGGYYIPVRNDWNNKVTRRFISEKDKEAYFEQFGEEIITENDFFNWWKNNHHFK
ncbi:MAG: hypothetical protein A2041_12295 [Bacteroidetes bacterium GWA2_31_9b]|nr:MAG: hypothetical protein A2041_12295 [Bacteroidetes bacterium GWA2_31_9b]